MTGEQRISYLLSAARRAERHGELHVARALRRMAEDCRPIDRALTLSVAEVETAA